MSGVRKFFAFVAGVLLPVALALTLAVNTLHVQFPHVNEELPRLILSHEQARTELIQGVADDIRQESDLVRFRGGAYQTAQLLIATDEFVEEFEAAGTQRGATYRGDAGAMVNFDLTEAVVEAGFDPEFAPAFQRLPTFGDGNAGESDFFRARSMFFSRARLVLAAVSAACLIVLALLARSPRLIFASLGFGGAILTSIQAILVRGVEKGFRNGGAIDQLIIDLVIPRWWTQTLLLGLASGVAIGIYLIWLKLHLRTREQPNGSAPLTSIYRGKTLPETDLDDHIRRGA